MISAARAGNPNDSARAPKASSTRSKYGAEPTTADGVRFDSKREADRYQELLLEQRGGGIADLELQPQYPLQVRTPLGTTVVIGRYIADFRYRRAGVLVVEDAKGFRGKELYLWKKRHVESQYGITVTEV